MDQEEAPPPPYSAVDPLLAPNSRNNTSSQAIAPGVSVSPTQDASSSRVPTQPTVVPTHFRSAAAYFEERLPSVIDESRGLLPHHMTIYPRSQAKDFPRRPRCWASRFNEITQQDWDTFLKYLFPPQLGLAASSQHLPRQLRAEIRRDRKDRPQETDEQRKARIAAVVAEWNECFFGLRATHVVFVYVGEPDSAPSSALCPRCYPAATGSVEGQPIRNSNAPSPVPGQHVPLGPCLLLGSPTPTYMCPHLHMVYMASLHTLLPYPLTSHPNITPIHLKAHGNGTIGTIRSSNRSIPTTAPRAERVGGSHRSHHKRRNMGSGSANRHYNMETKSVRRRSIMDVRSRNRLLHMAAGLKSRQGFIVGKHQ